MSEKTEKQFTLEEIKSIAEKITYIVGGRFAGTYFPGVTMKFQYSYLLKSWAVPFLNKAELIIQQ